MAPPPASAATVTVVLPLLGDALPLLAAVGVLVERWPAEIDARLVVAAPPLGARDRALLDELGDDVRVVEVPGSPALGALAVEAAREAGDAPVLVLDPAALPAARALAALADGAPVEGAVLAPAALLTSAPVLTAACSLPALAALLQTLEPVPAPPARLGPPVVPGLPASAGRAGLLSVVLPLSGPVDAARAALAAVRRGTRVCLELLVVDAGLPLSTRTWLSAQRDLRVVPPTGRGLVADVGAALAASCGDALVLLDAQVQLPRFWAEGLRRALAEDGVVAAGPRGTFLPGPQGAPADADPEQWRRRHAAASGRAPRLDAGCLAVRRSALAGSGLLDEAYTALPVAVSDLLLRLRPGGALAVADDVLVTVAAPRPLSPAARTVDLRRLTAVHGPRLGDDVWLSAALIVKDEQAALPACLAALRGVVDEVVVCDTGSTDRTVEVAQAFGARLLSSPWTGDFAAARNAALDACRGRWVLSVDADEQLRLEPGTDLRLQLLALETDTDAATLVIRSRSEQDGGPSFEHAAGRLFRRGHLRWVGAVHENLHDVRTATPPTYLPTTGVVLDHDGYLGHVYEARDKGSRNLLLAEKDHAQALDSGDAARLWKTGYELARALSKDDGNEARVEELLRDVLATMPPGLAHLRCDAHVRLATALAHQGRLAEAEQAARDGLRVDAGDPGLLLVLGQVLAVQGRHADALALLDGRAGASGSVHDLGKLQVDLPLLRARLLGALGRGAEAADVLCALADRHLDALDWPLLHAVLHATGEGLARLAGVVVRAPEQALAALDGLPEAERARLFAAVRALGVDPDAATPAALHAQRLDAVLHGHDPAAVAQAALALEDTDPADALALWERLPDAPEVRVARARCLLQTGRTDDAVAVVEGVDLARLGLEDLLVVVALAAAAGDRDTAQALLDSVQEVPDALRETVGGLAATLGLVV